MRWTRAHAILLCTVGVDELLARLRAVLRPEALEGSTRLRVGGLLIDVAERRVARDGEDVPLRDASSRSFTCSLASTDGS